jgi:restriction endonuclease S subunit
MDRLEAVEIRLSEVRENNEVFRFDTEYFKKLYLNIENLFKNNQAVSEIAKKVSCGPFGSNLLDTLYQDDGILVVRPFNIKNNKIEKDNLVYISNASILINNLRLYTKGTIMFARVGDVKCGVLDREKATISPNIIAVELKENADISPQVLCLFFNCRYGKSMLEKEIKVVAQPTISTSTVSKIKFPRFSKNANEKLTKMIEIAHTNEDISQSLYKTAEDLLLSNLGFDKHNVNTSGIAIKSFKESFGTSGRLDSEYYQHKYDELEDAIRGFDNDILGNLVCFKKSIEPGSGEYTDEGISFVRVSNLSKYEISQPEIFLNRVPFAHMNLQPKKDTILLSKDGSVGIAYKVEEDMDMVTSGAILHLTVKDTNRILPDYLTLVLNSMVVQLQAERDAGGSIIQHWKPSEIEKVKIPILDMPVQEKISQKIRESFALRKKSMYILEIAKRAVEMAIEQCEDVAISWIYEKIKEQED